MKMYILKKKTTPEYLNKLPLAGREKKEGSKEMQIVILFLKIKLCVMMCCV